MFEGWRGGVAQLQKGFAREHDRVTAMAGKGRMADGLRMLAMESEEGAQRRGAQLGLVAEGNHPGRQAGPPTIPSGGALDGTEHAAGGIGIDDGLARRETESPQFGEEGAVGAAADDGDLAGP